MKWCPNFDFIQNALNNLSYTTAEDALFCKMPVFCSQKNTDEPGVINLHLKFSKLNFIKLKSQFKMESGFKLTDCRLL